MACGRGVDGAEVVKALIQQDNLTKEPQEMRGGILNLGGDVGCGQASSFYLLSSDYGVLSVYSICLALVSLPGICKIALLKLM